MALLAGDAKDLLAPFKNFVNKQALSVVYRCLKLAPKTVYGCSANGMLSVDLQLGLESTVYVEASAFLALLDSLPRKAELVIELADDGEGNATTLNWVCGSAKGRLALMVVEGFPKMPKMPEEGWAPPLGFIDGLLTGALSCDPQAMASVGIHGMAIYRGKKSLSFCSSDNATISMIKVAHKGLPEGFAEVITLAPDAAALLAGAMAEDGLMAFDGNTVYYWDEGTRLVLKQVAPLKHNLMDKVAPFAGAPEKVAKIPRERIAAFVKRVAALAEAKRATDVILHAHGNELTLEFADQTAASEELYMLEGLDDLEELQIKLEAGRLAKALDHVTEVVLDHVAQGVLIFLGDDPPFMYLVAGKK